MHATLTNLKTLMEDMESSPKRRTRNNVKRFYKTVEDNKIKPKLSGLKDIAGYEDVKKQIKTLFVLPLKQPQLYLNRQSQKTLLLFGPPGTGKTQLVHALAAETNADIYSLTASTIMSAYIGETEKMVEIMFKVMKHVPRISILFLDEIDGLCRKRHGSEQDHNRRLKTEFMCQLSNFDENPQSFLICATNCPWDLDTAFLRRFNNRIYVPLPNRFERVELLRLYTKDTVLYNTFPFWEDLLNITEGYSCSDLNDLVRNALLRPVNELNDIKIWKLVDDTHYIPVSKVSVEEFGEHLRFCNLEELPDKSVRARDATLEDLLESTNEVKPTVPLREIERFDEYIKWH
ncbi:PREDICTED: suppressor protein of bem1/bed5 double mutants-like [Nicrophorus vespilloides]|uniref:Suppressor protein of bem1/bed5 double mutants-like n=1 Tax=Nicrophorus vespilloides TaxID=110193 RepID=A0ABM1MRN1_NICVS|nr:PREDICTED: suppressor protein of bem1/bed5 double mutants-like [Nicrophorus vespilloides]